MPCPLRSMVVGSIWLWLGLGGLWANSVCARRSQSEHSRVTRCRFCQHAHNAAASPAGSIRDPKTLDYVSLPGCSSLSNSSPQDPKGGCVWHQDQFRSMQPEIDSVNLFAGGNWKLNDDLKNGKLVICKIRK